MKIKLKTWDNIYQTFYVNPKNLQKLMKKYGEVINIEGDIVRLSEKEAHFGLILPK